jgi:hypothetical protein
MKQEKLLNWLSSEKSKDQTELDSEKKRFANQLLKLKKEDLFNNKKESLWTKIKNLLWGN